MHNRVLAGVVTRDGDRYFGTCDEAGTTSSGRTVAEAFANLQTATWRRLVTLAGQEPSAAESEA